MKKLITIILAAVFSLQALAVSISAAPALSTAEEDPVFAETNAAEYENNEVFVMYADGSYELLTLDSQAEVAATLEDLAADSSVALVQPNYSYVNTSLEVSDAYAAQQWALYNDGTFQMQEEKNQHPVYDEPFGVPQAPGQWHRPTQPGFRGMAASGGQAVAASAVSGIDINAIEGWTAYAAAEETRTVIVAMVDTGIDYDHEDLQGRIWVNEDEVAGNGVDDDGNGYIDDVYGWNFYGNNNRVYTGDEDSHGTHGAGTIVAAADNDAGITGVSQSDAIQVMAVKALGGKEGTGSTASIIKAIQYAEANGASICNLSLGTTSNDMALYRAIANSDMLFVVAAGNDAADTDKSPCYPASYDLDNIISVANLSYDGTLHYSSNYGGDSVDIAAPGSYILSTTPENSYSYMSGTSMAAPMVSAVAAMVYSYYSDISLADVKEIVLAAASPLSALDGKVATGGMVDLGAVLTYDVSQLSGTTWSNGTTATGIAPSITLKTYESAGRTYLTVTVNDGDGDLSLVAYAAGVLTAEDFAGGSQGTQVRLGADGSVTFAVNNSGSVTFYAVDSAGNETVESIHVTVSVRGVRQTRSSDAWSWPWR